MRLNNILYFYGNNGSNDDDNSNGRYCSNRKRCGNGNSSRSNYKILIWRMFGIVTRRQSLGSWNVVELQEN